MRLSDYDKHKVLVVLVATLLYSALAFCQKPEYDFYPEFRNSFTPQLRAPLLQGLVDLRPSEGRVRPESTAAWTAVLSDS